MAEQNPIYVKLKYEEGIDSKKDILSTELSLLNIIKIIQRYNSIRTEEFKVKSRIFKAVKELNLTIRKTQSSFPFLKIPSQIKRKNNEDREIITKKIDRNLESELKEIQDRLILLNQGNSK
jgi:hypothetical protein